jgi:16S rRNA (guanine527-N7)-methyltransferase
VDLGSGGGLPALPLAHAGVGETWMLVESRRNKTLFLRKVIEELGIDGMKVETSRLESLLEQGAFGPFAGFTSRATLRLGPTLILAAQCVPIGGSTFLWKGTRLDQEMVDHPEWRSNWSESGRYAIEETPTVVVRFTRTA